MLCTYIHYYIFTYFLILGLGGGPFGQPPLASHHQVKNFCISPSHILQIELCEGVMGFTMTG